MTNVAGHQAAAMFVQLLTHTIRRLWCIRLFVLCLFAAESCKIHYLRSVSIKIRMRKAESPSANPIVARVTHQTQADLETFLSASWDESNAMIAIAIPQ